MDIREDFKRANELKFRGDYREALEIYEKHFKENPQSFKFKDKENYAWILYRVNVQTFKNEEDFYGSAEFITKLVPQKDINVSKNCAYTSAVFSVLNQLNDDNDYFSMIPWLDKINPELLDEKPFRRYGRINKSKKEKFYDYASRAYYKTQDYDACIEVSTHALESLNSFRDDGDIWLKRNIGMSLKESGRLTESLPYLLEVIKVKHDWYIYRDIAEVYCMLKRPLDALEYCCPVVLSDVSDYSKINIYYLIYRILEGFNEKQALKHAQYFYLLKKEKGYRIPEDIENLGIDETRLDKLQLKGEITEIWQEYKFRDIEPSHGTVVKFIEEKNYGFIRPEKGKTMFFHASEFTGDTIYVGQKVKFYTQKAFDRSKKRESLNAVYIRAE